jgi:hypothetical protein
MSDPEMNNAFKKMYYDTVENYNNSIISNIQNVINIKYFYINEKIVNINTKIQNILLALINELENNIKMAKIMENPILETYRKLIYSHMGHHIFHKIKENVYICYTDIYILFPGLNPSNDIIAKTGLSLSEIFLNNIKKSGGSKNNVLDYTIGNEYVFNYEIRNDDDYNKIMDKLIIENTGEAVKFGIYYAVSKYEWSNKFETIYNIYNTLYNFYAYNGATNLNSIFLKRIVELYRNNKLSKMSCQEFDEIVKDYNKTMPTEEEEEARIMDEWESDIQQSQSYSRPQSRKRGRNFLNIISRSKNKTKRISKGR